ncbi:hypothetical protein ISCGN_016829 [Ixodes scapularis]
MATTLLQRVVGTGTASKLCTENGTWYLNPLHGQTWTNYSQCFLAKTSDSLSMFEATMNFPPVSDARKVTEKKAAADAQRQEEAAQRAAEAAVFDDQSKCFQLIELVQSYPWLYAKLRRDHKDNPKRENAWKEIARQVGILHYDICRTKWKYLRDKYAKEAAKITDLAHDEVVQERKQQEDREREDRERQDVEKLLEAEMERREREDQEREMEDRRREEWESTHEDLMLEPGTYDIINE